MKLSGIYRIKNIITSECYVGSSINIERRWKEHRSQLKNNKHDNPKLQASYNKYGEDAFKYEIFEICPAEYIIEREQERIDTGAFKFNICLIATKPPSQLGNTHNKGRVCSAETKAKLSAVHKGNMHSKGRVISAETRAKLSAAGKRRYANLKNKNSLTIEEI